MAEQIYKSVEDFLSAMYDPGNLSILLTTLGTLIVDQFDYNGFSLVAILALILKNAEKAKLPKAEMFRDMVDIVLIGLTRGNIRNDQVTKTVGNGGVRIAELSKRYQIPLRSNKSSRINLQPATLTFTRSLNCFPNLASLLLHKIPNLAKRGAETVLKTHELPDAMKHAGFAGLIPQVNRSLQSIYMLAHVAYMIEFGMMINPNVNGTVSTFYQAQLNFAKISCESSRFSDEMRIGYLRSFGLTSRINFEKILTVALRLTAEMKLGELPVNRIRNNYLKDDMICYYSEAGKDKMIGDKVGNLIDKFQIQFSGAGTQASTASITEASTSEDADFVL